MKSCDRKLWIHGNIHIYKNKLIMTLREMTGPTGDDQQTGHTH